MVHSWRLQDFLCRLARTTVGACAVFSLMVVLGSARAQEGQDRTLTDEARALAQAIQTHRDRLLQERQALVQEREALLKDSTVGDRTRQPASQRQKRAIADERRRIEALREELRSAKALANRTKLLSSYAGSPPRIDDRLFFDSQRFESVLSVAATKGRVSLRAAPGRSAERISVLQAGRELLILARQKTGRWRFVVSGGRYGYVDSTNLRSVAR